LSQARHDFPFETNQCLDTDGHTRHFPSRCNCEFLCLRPKFPIWCFTGGRVAVPVDFAIVGSSQTLIPGA
jgi:hypothetical protein